MQETLHALELLLEFVALLVFAGFGAGLTGFLVLREPLLALVLLQEVSSTPDGFALAVRFSAGAGRSSHASYDVLHAGAFGLEVLAHRHILVFEGHSARVLLSEVIGAVGLGIGQVQEVVVNGFTQQVRYDGAAVVRRQRLVKRASAETREQVLGCAAVHALFRRAQVHVCRRLQLLYFLYTIMSFRKG